MDESQTHHILPARREDIGHILEIERFSFTDPWTRSMFESEFDHPDAASFLLWEKDQAAAFIFLRRIFDEWAVLNIAVRPDFRRQGRAYALMSHVIRLAQKNQIKKITLEVNEKNHPAIKLYESLGFITVGRRPGYYSEQKADAILMDLLISPLL
jgi:ribosomal-protein-alanine N-acetyltransferase